MSNYDQAIEALANKGWTDDQANYLSWPVEVGRAASGSKEETLSHRVTPQFAHHELSPDLAKAIT